MRPASMLRHALLLLGLLLASPPGHAADYPAPRDGVWVARDFRFDTGETLPELRLHYLTLGEPGGLPVLILHGTGGPPADC
jgi:homoserine O-acetyltransferase